MDCIFLGSPLVLMGVDPVAFGAGYEDRAGKRVRCFNFGVPGRSSSCPRRGHVRINSHPQAYTSIVSQRATQPGLVSPSISTVHSWVS